MVNSKETKKHKAKQLRYKKPIAKDLNLDKINEDLWDIQETCEEIRWYTDSEDGEDSLINALDGDEDEAFEFKMAFADLCAECERMQEDLQEEWVPECFDIFFVAAGAGVLLGWDSYEQDYFGIDCTESWVEDGETVLCTDGQDIFLVEYEASLDVGFGDMDWITAWQPLPDPYKPEEDKP